MTSPAEPRTPARILIADDNPQILELLEAYLEPLGVRVTLAADGEATLGAVERTGPDLILLDIMMPRRSGFEVCRLLKEDPRYADIPIIMVTALNEGGDLERARECGADDYISKPVNKIELLNRVRNLLQIREQKRNSQRGGPPGADASTK
jgi:CheY-like chemotaxis protein